MGKFDAKVFLKDIRTSLSKHSPEILTGVGIAGMLATTVMAVKATPKALECIDKEIDRQNKELIREAKENGYNVCPQVSVLKPVEMIKVTWKCYIPAAVTGVTSIACLIGASSVNARRNAALATAYNVTRTALTEYKDKVVETIGEKKEHAIRENIAKDKIENDPVTNKEVIMTDKGNTLCYDAHSGRYFYSDIDTIKRAITKINRTLVTSSEMYASLNDFYNEIGLEPTKIGYDLGWNIDDGEIDIEFSSQLATDGRPCLVITYTVSPDYNYSKYM